jgi:tRNA-binding EMAP/Myf-like protein
VIRGVESNGMLLAAQDGGTVEVLFLDYAKPGDGVSLAGLTREGIPGQIDIEGFLSLPIAVEDFRVQVGGVPLECGGKAVLAARVSKGRVK